MPEVMVKFPVVVAGDEKDQAAELAPLKVVEAKLAFVVGTLMVLVLEVEVEVKSAPADDPLKIPPVSTVKFPATLKVEEIVVEALSSMWKEPSVVEEALP